MNGHTAPVFIELGTSLLAINNNCLENVAITPRKQKCTTQLMKIKSKIIIKSKMTIIKQLCK